jgi:hypothetical protein
MYEYHDTVGRKLTTLWDPPNDLLLWGRALG